MTKSMQRKSSELAAGSSWFVAAMLFGFWQGSFYVFGGLFLGGMALYLAAESLIMAYKEDR